MGSMMAAARWERLKDMSGTAIDTECAKKILL